CTPSRCTQRGFVGTPHTRAGGYPNEALSAATIMSAQKTRSVPPAMHHPWTAARVGLDAYQSLANAETKVEMLRRSYTESQTRPGRTWSSICCCAYSSKAYPAQNAGPSARSRITDIPSSVSAASMAAENSSRNWALMALYRSGRQRIMDRTL